MQVPKQPIFNFVSEVGITPSTFSPWLFLQLIAPFLTPDPLDSGLNRACLETDIPSVFLVSSLDQQGLQSANWSAFLQHYS